MKENLVLEGYGITLRRLTSDKIEVVRQWRNDPKIQQYMVYRQEITPEMQKKWFDKINNDNNFYFIIEYQGKEIGLVNIKDIDYENKCGEDGIFIYDESLLNSDVSIRVSLLMRKFVFETLDLEYEYGRVLKENIRAIKFNLYMGAKIDDSHSDKDCIFVKRTKQDYSSFLLINKSLVKTLSK